MAQTPASKTPPTPCAARSMEGLAAIKFGLHKMKAPVGQELRELLLAHESVTGALNAVQGGFFEPRRQAVHRAFLADRVCVALMSDLERCASTPPPPPPGASATDAALAKPATTFIARMSTIKDPEPGEGSPPRSSQEAARGRRATGITKAAANANAGAAAAGPASADGAASSGAGRRGAKRSRRAASLAAGAAPAKRMAAEARAVLNAWFREHLEDPNPSAEELERLAGETRLAPERIRNWINNKKQRVWGPAWREAVQEAAEDLNLRGVRGFVIPSDLAPAFFRLVGEKKSRKGGAGP